MTGNSKIIRNPAARMAIKKTSVALAGQRAVTREFIRLRSLGLLDQASGDRLMDEKAAWVKEQRKSEKRIRAVGGMYIEVGDCNATREAT
jgi:hypothetical protein